MCCSSRAPSLNARGDIKLAPPEFSSNSHRPRPKHVISQINFDYHKLDLHRFVARLLNHLITLCLGVVACQFSSARIRRRDKALFHFALFNSRRRARAGRRGAQYKICDVAACQSQLGSIIIIIVVHYPVVLCV